MCGGQWAARWPWFSSSTVIWGCWTPSFHHLSAHGDDFCLCWDRALQLRLICFCLQHAGIKDIPAMLPGFNVPFYIHAIIEAWLYNGKDFIHKWQIVPEMNLWWMSFTVIFLRTAKFLRIRSYWAKLLRVNRPSVHMPSKVAEDLNQVIPNQSLAEHCSPWQGQNGQRRSESLLQEVPEGLSTTIWESKEGMAGTTDPETKMTLGLICVQWAWCISIYQPNQSSQHPTFQGHAHY